MSSDFERGWRAACKKIEEHVQKMLDMYGQSPFRSEDHDNEMPSQEEMELARVKGTINAIANQCPQGDTCVIHRSPPSSS